MQLRLGIWRERPCRCGSAGTGCSLPGRRAAPDGGQHHSGVGLGVGDAQFHGDSHDDRAGDHERVGVGECGPQRPGVACPWLACVSGPARAKYAHHSTNSPAKPSRAATAARAGIGSSSDSVNPVMRMDSPSAMMNTPRLRSARCSGSVGQVLIGAEPRPGKRNWNRGTATSTKRAAIQTISRGPGSRNAPTRNSTPAVALQASKFV